MANEKRATLTIFLKDLASDAIKKTSVAMQSLRDNALRIGAAFTALTGVIALSLRAWAAQEQSVAKLDNALKASGKSAAGATERLVKLAEALQSLTTFEDEVIISSQALLATFGLTEKQIADLTPRILDMASATGTDLHAATLALGKAIATGNAGALSRYGVLLDENILKTRDMKLITQALDAQFKGMAQALGSTGTGAFIRLKNVTGELFEEMGKFISYILRPFVELAISVAVRINQVSDGKKKMAAVVLLLASVFTGLLVTMASVSLALPALAAGLALLTGPVGIVIAGITGMTLALGFFWAASEKTKTAVVRIFAEMAAVIASVAKGIEFLMRGRLVDAADELRKAMESAGKLTSESFKEAFSSMGDDFDILKKKLMEQINVPPPVMGAFPSIGETAQPPPATSAPVTGGGDSGAGGGVAGGTEGSTPPTQPPPGGVTEPVPYSVLDLLAPYTNPYHPPGTSGWRWRSLEQGWEPQDPPTLAESPEYWNQYAIDKARFSALHPGQENNWLDFAAGGIVMPRQGGTRAIIGEAGSPEAVIPLDSMKGKQMLGGGVNITIQAGTLIADDMSVQEFARRIDRELYKLSRNKQSNAI